ncbi:tigger transposable element-derived protein 1-like [Stegodyphus dumicola]|uniref:tigger transposable element-derived protein 1-like n=1 Tax=Stegodyphus dumicola TaxID=202533 RepID=UPI0015AD86C2|nr:tigger transposable element-derived protein 1-like [Stegodyphus dumicola]
MIRKKTKALYDQILPDGDNEKAEEGTDEPQATSSADNDAACRYVEEELPNLISKGGYLPEQVFNMDETCLFWKRMPSRTFLFKDEVKRPGFKAYKDRVTIIMAGNAEGFMLKPGFVYKAKNPRVKLYLAEKGLPFKVLLLMDCAGGIATDLQYDDVQIEFLPPNTTSPFQPMDQGVIRAFKALYTRSKIWKKLWPNVVHDYPGFTPEEVHHSAVEKAVRLAHIIRNEGFVDMTKEDISALIDCHSDPLTDEDLLEMTKSAC